MSVFDSRVCALGEGPLWHPLRGQLFWFDILGKRLLSRAGEEALVWQFDRHVSAAGWVSRGEVLIASESGLFLFNLERGEETPIAALEADNPVTRSNDGRADPWGGFWIGTMGKNAEPGAGAIYRFYQGQITQLFDGITISNSICFAPDRSCAYFTDTPSRQIMRQALDGEGWPVGAAQVFVDLRAEGLNPDGSVVDVEGRLWNAQWGASRVACYAPDGQFVSAETFAGTQISCPAFGGPAMNTLFATSAATGLDAPRAVDGQTLAVEAQAQGQAEHRVIL